MEGEKKQVLSVGSFMNGVGLGIIEELENSLIVCRDTHYCDVYEEMIDVLRCENGWSSTSQSCNFEVAEPTPRTVRNKVKCPQCSAELVSFKGMKQHIAKMHDRTQKNVPCSLCNKYFMHKYALEFHIKQVHEKSTRVKCQVCLKVFYNKYSHRVHVATKHP